MYFFIPKVLLTDQKMLNLRRIEMIRGPFDLCAKAATKQKGPKNLGYLTKKQSFFLIKGLLFGLVPQIILALLVLKQL